MKEKGVIDDWIDGEELRSLAEKLLTPPPEPTGPEEEAVYGPDFEGFAGPLAEREPGREKKEAREPKPIFRSDSPAGVNPEAEKMMQPNPFHQKEKRAAPGLGKRARDPAQAEGATASPFRVSPRKAGTDEGPERRGQPDETELREFLAWLREQIPLEACLVGRGGEELFFDDLHDKQMCAVSALLAGAAHRKTGNGGKSPESLVVKLPASRILQVVPLEDGCHAGLVLPRPLADSGVQALVKAFQGVFP